MYVVKFGGTSVGSPQAVEKVFAILTDAAHKGKVRIAVVSAFSGVTDALVACGKEALSGGAYKDSLEKLRSKHFDMAQALFANASGSKMPPELSDYIEKIFNELSRILDGVEAVRELSARTLDLVMSSGERLSAKIIASYFASKGEPCEYLDSRLVIKTDGVYGKARYLPAETEAALANYIKNRNALQIAAGFIGEAPDGSTTTLGRGGSDFSAAIYAAALSAPLVEAVEIWTDVDGILSADPRVVPNAFRMDEISFIEALELSHFGAKVLYPPTVRPALEKNIPIRIRNTFNPQGKGTWIKKDAAPSPFPVRGISSLDNVSLLRLQGSGMAGTAGYAARLFDALARKSISVILITQASSEYSICAALDPVDVYAAAAAVMEEFEREIAAESLEKPAVENGCSIIAVVGSRMKSLPGISGTLFEALGQSGVNIKAIAQGSSETNISTVIAHEDKVKALTAVHNAFFLPQEKTINLFLVGTGLIGGTLLKQIAAQKEALFLSHKVRINLAGLANSRKMVFAQGESLSFLDAPSLLEKGAAFSKDEFFAKAKAQRSAVFCDCTANEAVAQTYASMLEAGIPVVTPNKRACGGALSYYKLITSLSREKGAPYLYEATVCAGLPVLSTLRDLHLAGDKVVRIEAVLSGTLSFIFNNFDGARPFSSLVKLAKEKGYTEPDPRDDLRALDAARKALILARECGADVEMDDVQIEPLLNERCLTAPSVEAFFAELEKCDADFEKRRAAAAQKNAALRYVGIIEKNEKNGAQYTSRLVLREEREGSPFRTLSGADNIVVITTERYNTQPMVIRGPGAGAEVTAGIVFADILRTAVAC